MTLNYGRVVDLMIAYHKRFRPTSTPKYGGWEIEDRTRKYNGKDDLLECRGQVRAALYCLMVVKPSADEAINLSVFGRHYHRLRPKG